MSVYKEYHHMIPSLEVYPRIHFFSKRYHDIKEKYRKFTDKSRKKFSIDLDAAPQNYFENGLTIKVVGKEDLDPSVFIATKSELYKSQPSADVKTKVGIVCNTVVPVNPHENCNRRYTSFNKTACETKKFSTPVSTAADVGDKILESQSQTKNVVICNAIVERLDDRGIEDIKKLWDTKDPNHCIGYFLLCQSKTDFTEDERNAFITKLGKSFRSCWKPIQVISKRQSGVKIGDEVSLCLEDELVKNLLTIQSNLQTHTTDKKRCNNSKPLLEEENVKLAISSFLHNVPGYVIELSKHVKRTGLKRVEKMISDLTVDDTKTTEVPLRWADIKKDNSLMPKFALILKCSIAQALSKRHSVSIQTCNHILIQNIFEGTCISKFSPSLVYRIKKLCYCSEVGDENVHVYQAILFPRVLSELKNDLSSFVTDIEKGVSQFATSCRKFLFEIGSCLKKTKVDIDKMKEKAVQAKTKVDFSLRKEILSIKEVYGVGTIYGHLEIHVNDIGAIEKVESQIRDMFRRKNVSCPFSVRAIELKLEMLADHTFHEHGERIECEERTGTLAGFVQGSDQRLYGLTCAHVVKAEEGCDVFIYDGSQRRLEFAKCVPHLIVSTGSQGKPLIDFAAVIVTESVEDKCVKFLKNEDSMLNPGIIAADKMGDLAGNYVYKHGASSQLTKGLVYSDDYSTLSTEEEHYIFLIENYDDDGEVFALSGDSGAMICTPDENEVYIVKAVGVLNGGTITPSEDDTQIFFSFRLIDGLRKLREGAGDLDFNFPKEC